MDYFLDKRFIVTGKKSVLHLDYPFNLTEFASTLIMQLGLTGAQNGLNIQPVLSNSGIQLNYVELGGTLIRNTTISGANFNMSLTGLGTYTLSSVNNNITSSSKNTITSDINEFYSSSELRLKTPRIISASENDGSYLYLKNATTGESEFRYVHYRAGFTNLSWIGQTISIPQSTHLRGVFPTIQVFTGVGTFSVILPLGIGNPLVSITVNPIGDVTLTCSAGMEFSGQVIIT